MADLPPPPPGFTLDKTSQAPPIPPPPGFRLDVQPGTGLADRPAPPARPGLLSRAAANFVKPLIDIPKDIAEEFSSGSTQVGEGENRLFGSNQSLGSRIRGAGQIGGGIIGQATAPITGASRALVGDPLRANIPQDTFAGKFAANLGEDAASVLGPGLLSKLAKAGLTVVRGEPPPGVTGEAASASKPPEAPVVPAAEKPSGEAPPFPGSIRLYRGTRPGNHPNGQWFTTDKEKAANYGETHHVDVTPEELRTKFFRPWPPTKNPDTGEVIPHPLDNEYVTNDPEILEKSRLAKVKAAATPPTAKAVEAPGPILDLPAAGEGTKATQTRIDDSLYRLSKNATADKIEAAHFLRDVDKDVLAPATQERLYGALEQRLIDPDAPMPPELQKAEAVLKPWKDEEARLYREIKAKGLPEGMAEMEQTPGYVHRIVQGRGSYFDRADPDASRVDPITGQGRSLSKRASSLQARRYYVMEGPDGRRVMARDVPDDVTPGLRRRGPDGRLYTYKLATTAEIEAATGTRYYKNALVNTVDNVLRLRRVKRNMDLLDQLKPQLEGKTLWQPLTKQAVPPGWQEVHLPQMRGYADPRIAHVLNDFRGSLESPDGLAHGLAAINRFVTGSLFFTPIPHAANVLNHWIVGRGFDWVTPAGYRSLLENGARAIRAVATQNDAYVRMLREGSGLLYGDTAQQNFYKLMIEKMGREMTRDPQTFKAVMKELGTTDFWRTPGDFIRQWYRTSSKALWAVNDMFMLQRQFELMQRGMGAREAIREAEKDIPNYRIPPEVMGSRAAAEFLRNPNFMLFGRYRYGQFRAVSELVKDLVKNARPGARKEAIGKALVMAVMMAVAYPLARAAVQRVTGNRKADVQRFGPFSPIESMLEWGEGERDQVAALSSLIVPSPWIRMGEELLTNKDVFGRDVVNPQSTALGKAVQGGEAAASQFAPLQLGLTAAKPGGLAQVAGRQVGIRIPPPGQEKGRAIGKRIERRAAVRRERNDPVEQFIRKHLGM